MDDEGFQAQKEDASGHFWSRWLAGPPKAAAVKVLKRRGRAAGAADGAAGPAISGSQFAALAFDQVGRR